MQKCVFYKLRKVLQSSKFNIKFHVVRAASLWELLDLLHVQTDSLHDYPGHLKEKIIHLSQNI